MFRENKNIIYTCVTVGIVLLASKYRSNVLSSVTQICHSITRKSNKKNTSHKNNSSELSSNNTGSIDKNSNGSNSENYSNVSIVKKNFKISLDKVILVDSPEKCDYAIQRIRHDLSDGILGFDCEWVNSEPVSLIQIATYNGVCALFRIQKIGFIPPKLKELLSNQHLIKVGVGPLEDGQRLTRDYGCRVFGTLDLRTLAENYNLPSPKSLSELCKQYLDLELNKVLEVRCSDWNADVLTDEQIAYASYDVLTAVLIYHQIQQHAKQNRSTWQNLIVYFKSICNNGIQERYYCLPIGIIDARFRKKNEICTSNNIDKNGHKNGQINRKICNIPARNKPLYHNCYLEAPDGEILCTCDKKKAEWYVSKELGQVVNNEPFTVRLKFEPSGRALGEDGKYYTQVKKNQCVVCGASEKFIKKNVVPREYRKYFPLAMKAHQSHDVLLLCPLCHDKSNYQDLQLRRYLANLCDAPISSGFANVKSQFLQNYQLVQSAVQALKGNSEIPMKQRIELERYITKRTGVTEFTEFQLTNLSEHIAAKIKHANNSISSCTIDNQTKSQPHGLKVVRYFEDIEGGLVELEKMWREHFLTSMEPKFLPELWSVSHNEERLTLRQTQNKIEANDARVAGLGS